MCAEEGMLRILLYIIFKRRDESVSPTGSSAASNHRLFPVTAVVDQALCFRLPFLSDEELGMP